MVKGITVPEDVISSKIYLIRGQRVMLDMDLAELYDVETKQLKRAVKRNADRFPQDFMFKLTGLEFENLRCQIGTSSWGGVRHQPMAFTEQGVAMLSSVLNSKRAIAVNIRIIRVFNQMRKLVVAHKGMLAKIEKVEKRVSKHDRDFKLVFLYMKKLLNPLVNQRRKIAFKKTKRSNSIKEWSF